MPGHALDLHDAAQYLRGRGRGRRLDVQHTDPDAAVAPELSEGVQAPGCSPAARGRARSGHRTITARPPSRTAPTTPAIRRGWHDVRFARRAWTPCARTSSTRCAGS